MRHLIFLVTIFLCAGCAYDLVEEITFHENREVTGLVRLDFEESMRGQYREQVMQMIVGAASAMIGEMGDSTVKKMNLEQYSKADTLVKFIEIAMDTVKSIQKDSIYEGLVKRDSMNVLTEEEKQRLSSFGYEFMKRVTVRININVPANVCYFEIEANHLPWDKLESYSIDDILKKMEHDSSMAFSQFRFLNDFSLKWINHKVESAQQAFGKNDKQPLPKDSIQVAALKNSHMVIRYHFPGKVVKNSNKYFKVTNNGRTIEFKESLYDITKSKIDMTTVTTYK